MADNVLSRAELEALTGMQRPSAMMRVLTARNWVFEPPAKRGDVPKVARAYFDARMSGKPMPAAPRVGPRLDIFCAA